MYASVKAEQIAENRHEIMREERYVSLTKLTCKNNSDAYSHYSS